MRKTLRYLTALSALFPFLLLLNACAQKAPPLTFSGVWNVLKEDGISGQQVHSFVSVIVFDNRFRISSEIDGVTTVDIYDGKLWNHQSSDPQNAELSSNIPKTDAEMEPL